MLTQKFEYIVQPGDTLFGISLKFNVPLQTVIELNSIKNPDRIDVGDKIIIPVSDEFYQIVQIVQSQCKYDQTIVAPDDSVEDTPSHSQMTFVRYKMKRGDTIFSLARKYNTTQANILALNPNIKDVNNIPIGEIVTIPLPPENSYIYTVKPGDTVYSVAKAQNTTVKDIMEYNFIPEDYTIYPGQQLILVK